MLILDKSIQLNEIIVTISENELMPTNGYWMELHSTFSNKTYTIQLGANQSQHKERYDKFIINKTMFVQMEDGKYNYKIFSGETDNKLLEVGYLKIISTDHEITYMSIEPEEEEDDFIVYNQ